jgi:hypothetical protein
MLSVREFFFETQVFPILLIPLIGVPGEHTENGNAHQDIGGKAQQDLGERKDDQERQHRKTKSQQQDRDIQFIRAVAAFHEAAELFPHMSSSNFS